MTSSVPFGVTGSSRDGTAYTAVVRGLGGTAPARGLDGRLAADIPAPA